MKISNNKILKKICCGLPLLLFALTLSACGGGSDGGGVSETPVTYSGLTDQAALDETNSGQLAIDAFNGGATGESMTSLSMTDTSSVTNSNQNTLALTKLFNKFAQQIDVTNLATESNTAKAIYPITGPPEYGTCGGFATISGTFDDDALTFSATVSFSSFCDGGVTMTGNVTMFGALYGDYSYKKYTMIFSNIFVSQVGVFSYRAGGSISMDFDTNTVIISMVVLDNATNKTYWTKDYTMTVDDSGSPISITFSGTYYDHDEGFINVTTSPTDPILINYGAACPHDGVIEITGSNGTATLTITVLCTYNLVVDYTDTALTDHSETGTTWQ